MEEIETQARQRETADHVDDMVLIGQHSGEANEAEPRAKQQAQEASRPVHVEMRQYVAEGDVQRRELIEGLIEVAEAVEDHAEPAADVGAIEGEPQWHHQEADTRDENGGDDAVGERWRRDRFGRGTARR